MDSLDLTKATLAEEPRKTLVRFDEAPATCHSTYSSVEYDRTSVTVTRLNFKDMVELLTYRSDMRIKNLEEAKRLIKKQISINRPKNPLGSSELIVNGSKEQNLEIQLEKYGYDRSPSPTSLSDATCCNSPNSLQ